MSTPSSKAPEGSITSTSTTLPPTTTTTRLPTTSVAPTTQTSTTLPPGTSRIPTSCGYLKVTQSARVGYRDVTWYASAAFTDRALSYAGLPWWPESNGPVSLETPNTSFTIQIRCHDFGGTLLSESVTIV